MTRFNAIILTVFTLLAWSCNDSQQQEVELSAPAPWVGYWDFQNYPGPNERAYLRVPDDSGFDVTEKNQMLNSGRMVLCASVSGTAAPQNLQYRQAGRTAPGRRLEAIRLCCN